MKKSIKLHLVPNKNKEYKAEMFKDNELVKTSFLTQDELKNFMEQKIEQEQLKKTRLSIKLFKLKELTIILKE